LLDGKELSDIQGELPSWRVTQDNEGNVFFANKDGLGFVAWYSTDTVALDDIVNALRP
jgi:hypothetical protein